MRSYSLIIAILALLLIGCGGNSETNPNARFSVDRNTIDFVGTIGQQDEPSFEEISGTVTGADSDIFVRVELTDKGVIDTSRTKLWKNANGLTVYPGEIATLGLGVHTDSIVVKVCNDSACKSQIAGSPKTIAVNYEIVMPNFSFVTESVAIDTSVIDDSQEELLELSLFNHLYTQNIQVTSDLPIAHLDFSDSYGTSAAELPNSKTRYYKSILSGFSDFSEGLAQGHIIATLEVDGYQLETKLPIEVYVPEARLLADVTALAFTQFPNLSNLTSQINLWEKTGLDGIDWVATTDVDWLLIDNNGDLDSPLHVTAVPDGLSLDELHIAKIEITSTDPRVSNTEIINVAFWIGSEIPPDTNTEYAKYPYGVESRSYTTDNLRPYLYIVNEQRDTITVVNFYTNEVVAEISGLQPVYDFKANPSGSVLYISHGNNSEFTEIDLSNFSIKDTWSVTAPGGILKIPLNVFQTIIKPDDDDLIVFNDQYVVNTRTKTVFDDGTLKIPRIYYTLDKGGENYFARRGEFHCYAFNRSDNGCGQLTYSSYSNQTKFVQNDLYADSGAFSFKIDKFGRYGYDFTDGITKYDMETLLPIYEYAIDFENILKVDESSSLSVNGTYSGIFRDGNSFKAKWYAFYYNEEKGFKSIEYDNNIKLFDYGVSPDGLVSFTKKRDDVDIIQIRLLNF